MLGACQTESADNENEPQRGASLPELQPHGQAMGQKEGVLEERCSPKWTAAAHSPPTISEPDRPLAVLVSALQGGEASPVLAEDEAESDAPAPIASRYPDPADGATMVVWQGGWAPLVIAQPIPGGNDPVQAATQTQRQTQGSAVVDSPWPGSALPPGAQGAGMADSAWGRGSVPGGGLGGALASGVVQNAEGLPGLGEGLRGLVAETAMLDTSTDLQEGATAGAFQAYGRMFSRVNPGQVQRAVSAGVVGAAAARVRLGDAPLPSQALQGALAAAGMPGTTGERSTPGPSVGLALERGGMELAVRPGSDTVYAAGGSGGAAMPSLRGGDAGAGGRPGDAQAGGSLWAEAHAGAQPLERSPVDGGDMFAYPGEPGMQEQVADQVAYWVNQKTQNAELTLDRDGQPVEVSVSLSGNEAHVSFRSDQPQTRALLDQSMAQLGELLRSEGLVLSGMSVGTSSTEGRAPASDGGQPRHREGARRTQVTAAVSAGVPSLPRGGGITDRSVDIFV